MYSNTNLDDPKNDRQERISNVQVFYRDLRRMIMNGGEVEEEEPEAPDEMAMAFMAAGRRNLASRGIINPVMPGEAAIRRLPDGG